MDKAGGLRADLRAHAPLLTWMRTGARLAIDGVQRKVRRT